MFKVPITEVFTVLTGLYVASGTSTQVTLGTLFVGGDAYVVYNSVENIAYTGQPGDRTMRALLPVELSLDEIMSAFSGTPELPATAAGAELLRTEEGPALTVPAPSGSRTYLLDPERGAVARLEQRETGGRLLLRAEFSDFTTRGEPPSRRWSWSTYRRAKRASASATAICR